jgi:TatD DNase family protein
MYRKLAQKTNNYSDKSMCQEQQEDIAIPPPRDLTLVDTHCHLDMSPLNSRPEALLTAAHEAGVDTMITVGIDLDSSRRAISLAQRYTGVFATVGIHPHNVATITERDYEKLREMVHNDYDARVVAYGEIGLDFVKLHTPTDLQIVHFRRQLQLAKELQLPIVVHNREAHAQIMAILREESPFPAGGVMHCFSGDIHLAEQVMELGLFISIPGIVTFNNAKDMQEVARLIPLTALLLETDAPFLAPVPMRGKQNEPAFLPHTARRIAQLRDESPQVIARCTTANANRLFRLQSCVTPQKNAGTKDMK